MVKFHAIGFFVVAILRVNRVLSANVSGQGMVRLVPYEVVGIVPLNNDTVTHVLKYGTISQVFSILNICLAHNQNVSEVILQECNSAVVEGNCEMVSIFMEYARVSNMPSADQMITNALLNFPANNRAWILYQAIFDAKKRGIPLGMSVSGPVNYYLAEYLDQGNHLGLIDLTHFIVSYQIDVSKKITDFIIKNAFREPPSPVIHMALNLAMGCNQSLYQAFAKAIIDAAAIENIAFITKISELVGPGQSKFTLILFLAVKKLALSGFCDALKSLLSLLESEEIHHLEHPFGQLINFMSSQSFHNCLHLLVLFSSHKNFDIIAYLSSALNMAMACGSLRGQVYIMHGIKTNPKWNADQTLQNIIAQAIEKDLRITRFLGQARYLRNSITWRRGIITKEGNTTDIIVKP